MSEEDETQGRVARFWQPVADLRLEDRRRLILGAVLTVCLAVPLLVELFRAIASKGDQADVRNIGIALLGLFGGVFAVWRGLIAEKQRVVAIQQDWDCADLFYEGGDRVFENKAKKSIAQVTIYMK